MLEIFHLEYKLKNMEYIYDVQSYWWIVFIIAIWSIWSACSWLNKQFKNATRYSTCVRCGWELPEKQVFDDHCTGCQNITFEQIKKIKTDKRIRIFDTGYEPPIKTYHGKHTGSY